MTPEQVTRAGAVVIEAPTVDDGAPMWRIARDAGHLDLNSSYAYLLWCRDFAATSVVARSEGEVCGYVAGYRRPDAADTVFVWQVAVAPSHRGHRLARRMLDHLVDRLDPPVSWLEATITADNDASIALFSSFARDRGAPVASHALFDSSQFPDGHDGESLYRIGPFAPRATAA